MKWQKIIKLSQHITTIVEPVKKYNWPQCTHHSHSPLNCVWVRVTANIYKSLLWLVYVYGFRLFALRAAEKWNYEVICSDKSPPFWYLYKTKAQWPMNLLPFQAISHFSFFPFPLQNTHTPFFIQWFTFFTTQLTQSNIGQQEGNWCIFFYCNVIKN